MGPVGPVEGVTVLLVRVEEGPAGETLETRSGVHHPHQLLRPLLGPRDLLDHLRLLISLSQGPSWSLTDPDIAEV